MSNIFDGVRGAAFPDVVMNSGPLPPTDGLPAPLHDTADGRINYNSTLLGDLQPYAYGEPAYLSSQHSYLNIPHRIQKIIPVIYLPEPDGKNLFRLSHSVDDGDVAFTVRLNKMSLFCTGSKNSTRRNSMNTSVEALINLPTVNYILAGIQHAQKEWRKDNLWWDFLHALHPTRFNKKKLDISDIVYIVENYIKPFGIVRGSERQGGQNEEGNSPATWPVPFVTTLVIDGKEDHVVNMWHDLDVNAGEDLVLKLMPSIVCKYNLNHYYKNPVSKYFNESDKIIKWQLVPAVFHLEHEPYEEALKTTDLEYLHNTSTNLLFYPVHPRYYTLYKKPQTMTSLGHFLEARYLSWQNLGFWHIGRTQVRLNRFVTEASSYYHNDMVNALRSQYMQMTFQPTWEKIEHKFSQIDDSNPILAFRIKNFDAADDVLTTSGKAGVKRSVLEQLFEETPATAEASSDWVFVKCKESKEKQGEMQEAVTQQPASTAETVAEGGLGLKKATNKRPKTTQAGVNIRMDGSKEIETVTSL